MDVKEIWRIQGKKADFNELGKNFNITPITARLIRNRNHNTFEEYEKYLHGDILDMDSPMKLKDMEKSVEIIYSAIIKSKKIRIIGDYDIDGICSGYILTDVLKELGADVDFDVPERITDGYGLNERLIKQSFDDGVFLVITCDNGIAAKLPIDYAKSLGMQVIITDHHEIPFMDEDGVRRYDIPNADAVVNPKRHDCSYPFKELCGAGVVLKLIMALTDCFRKRAGDDFLSDNSYEEWLKKYYVFAAIATIGDVVELTGENRILVQYGLKNINNIHNFGLQALIEVNQLQNQVIESYHIGFVLGPCINAGGRLETARLAYCLFTSDNKAVAMERAMELKNINDVRKTMTSDYTQNAIDIIESSREYQNEKILVLYLEECHESLAGIIAGRLREKYHKPAFVITNALDSAKGSGRSIKEYHMFDNLVVVNSLTPCLSKFGGHSMAAGISLLKEKIPIFKKAINENCQLTKEGMMRKIWIDIALPFEYITEKMIEELRLLEPFGIGNEKPVFADKITSINKIQIRGKNKNVIIMNLSNISGKKIDAVLFQTEEEFRMGLLKKYSKTEIDALFKGYNSNISLSVTYYPEINEFNSYKSIRVVIKRYV